MLKCKDGKINVEEMIKDYKKLHPKPIWRLLKEIQQQAMLYANKIESIVSNNVLDDIKKKLENGNLTPEMPEGSSIICEHLPLLKEANNNIPIYQEALSIYQEAFIDVVNNYGGELLNELEFKHDQTVTVGVNTGWPPSISVSVVHTAEKVLRFK